MRGGWWAKKGGTRTHLKLVLALACASVAKALVSPASAAVETVRRASCLDPALCRKAPAVSAGPILLTELTHAVFTVWHTAARCNHTGLNEADLAQTLGATRWRPLFVVR